jgi:hypothetical protein
VPGALGLCFVASFFFLSFFFSVVVKCMVSVFQMLWVSPARTTPALDSTFYNNNRLQLKFAPRTRRRISALPLLLQQQQEHKAFIGSASLMNLVS